MKPDHVTYTVGMLLSEARDRLSGIDSARLDAELLLAHVLGLDRTALYTCPEHVPTAWQCQSFMDLLARRAGGEPLAYLIGQREFWSLPLTVTPDTLIPRPETELLVECALEYLGGRQHPCIADLGTGSGAIAIALARELPEAVIVATDFSTAALTVARGNAERLCPGRIGFHQGDWCEALGNMTFDVIVCNPPYVADGDQALQSDGVRFEPQDALASGPDGLAAIRQIIPAAICHLKPNGWLLLEHGAGQATAIAGLLSRHGYRNIALKRDLAGLPRASGALRPA